MTTIVKNIVQVNLTQIGSVLTGRNELINDALRGLNMEEVLKEIVEQLKLIRISISGIGFTLLLMLFFKNMHGK